MKCPVCNEVRMREVVKNGVHIDICPDCKGVWLDRGELEKLTNEVHELRKERDEWYEAPPQGPYPQSHGHHESDNDHHYPKHKKKKHTVFDVFDDLF